MNTQEKTGYIYVLTNESFHMENWIKIGYAEDVNKRVKELSNTSVPLPYDVYCTYEIPRIQGVKDPDKLLHDLINKLNPDLRIAPNREFFKMYPWEAYDMLYAIAQMHGRTKSLYRNLNNTFGESETEDQEYTVDSLFKDCCEEDSLYNRLKRVIESIDQNLIETPLKLYVAFKKDKKNVVSLWPRNGGMEVALNAKLGTIHDEHDLMYDISNRRWSSEQYAFKVFQDTDMEAVKDLIQQAYNLKK